MLDGLVVLLAGEGLVAQSAMIQIGLEIDCSIGDNAGSQHSLLFRLCFWVGHDYDQVSDCVWRWGCCWLMTVGLGGNGERQCSMKFDEIMFNVVIVGSYQPT